MAATDRVRYDMALNRWDALLAADLTSQPADAGSTIVLLPYDHSRDLRPETTDPFNVFFNEAFSLADQMKLRGQKVDVAIDATMTDFERTFSDPAISSIIVLGIGCLSSIAFDPSKSQSKRIDWEDVAAQADHLKTGRFTQRICGILPRNMNVPLGLLAVSDHRNVHAPVGASIAPTSLEHPDNQLIQPVTLKRRLTSSDIFTGFPRRTFEAATQSQIALGAIGILLDSRAQALKAGN